MAKKNENDVRRGWGHCGTSMYSHWFVANGPKGRAAVSLCGRVNFQGWAKGGWADPTNPPTNGCPVCRKQLDSNG